MDGTPLTAPPRAGRDTIVSRLAPGGRSRAGGPIVDGVDSRAYRWFRVAAVAEAVSWAGLLAGMYLKRVAEVTDLGVYVFGRLHGALFVAYLVATFWVARSERWSFGRTAVAALASIPPLTTLAFERWLASRRRKPVHTAG